MIHYVKSVFVFVILLSLYGCVTCEDLLEDRESIDVNGVIQRKYLQRLRPTPMLDLEIDGGKIVTISAPKRIDPGLWEKAEEGGKVIKKKGFLTYIYIEDGEEFHFTFRCE